MAGASQKAGYKLRSSAASTMSRYVVMRLLASSTRRRGTNQDQLCLFHKGWVESPCLVLSFQDGLEQLIRRDILDLYAILAL